MKYFRAHQFKKNIIIGCFSLFIHVLPYTLQLCNPLAFGFINIFIVILFMQKQKVQQESVETSSSVDNQLMPKLIRQVPQKKAVAAGAGESKTKLSKDTLAAVIIPSTLFFGQLPQFHSIFLLPSFPICTYTITVI